MWRDVVVHGVWLSALALGCDGGEKKSVPPPPAAGSNVIKTSMEIWYEGRLVKTTEGTLDVSGNRYVPRYVIGYDCPHARRLTVDMSTKARELVTHDAGYLPQPVVTTLSDERAALIYGAAIVAVMAGPYKPEPPSAGACKLSIMEMGRSLLELDMTESRKPDSASQLVKELLASDT